MNRHLTRLLAAIVIYAWLQPHAAEATITNYSGDEAGFTAAINGCPRIRLILSLLSSQRTTSLLTSTRPQCCFQRPPGITSLPPPTDTVPLLWASYVPKSATLPGSSPWPSGSSPSLSLSGACRCG